MGKMTTKNISIQTKGNNTRKKIFQVSVELINNKGYDETTIKDICQEANIGIGTFYHYFKSKQDILMAYVKEENENILDFYNSLSTDSYYENLLSIIEYQLDYIDLKGREFVRSVFTIELMNNVTLLGIDNYSAYNLVFQCLSKGQDNKEFLSEHSAEFMGDLIINSIFGYIHSWIKYTDKSIKQYCFAQIKELIDMFLDK